MMLEAMAAVMVLSSILFVWVIAKHRERNRCWQIVFARRAEIDFVVRNKILDDITRGVAPAAERDSEY